MSKVGLIRVSNSNPLVGEKLLTEVRQWLSHSGWGSVVSVAYQKQQNTNFVEFIPGRYQTNGPKRVPLKTGASLRDFEMLLARWLWEIES